MAVTGKLTQVQVSPDGRNWYTLPPAPDIGRFTYFYLYPYADIDTDNTARVRCKLHLVPPEGEEIDIDPIYGTLSSGTYYFPFTLQSGGEAALGTWKAVVTLEHEASEGEWTELDTWEGDAFNLIVVGEPSGEMVGVQFSPDGANWFGTPLRVRPGDSYWYRVIFNVFLPVEADVKVDLYLIDPYGTEIKQESPTSEFNPGASQGTATLGVDEVPDVRGDMIGRAIVKTQWEGSWVTLTGWDGRICYVQAPEEEGAPSIWEQLMSISVAMMLGGVVVAMIKK